MKQKQRQKSFIEQEKKLSFNPSKEAQEALSLLLDKVSFIGLTLGTVAFIASFLRITSEEWNINIISDTVFFAGIVVLILLRKRIPIIAVVMILLALVCISAIINFLTLGLATISFLILAACCVLAGVVFRIQVGLSVLFVSVIIISAIGIASHYSILSFPVNFEDYLNAPQTWITQIVGFVAFTILMLIIIGSIQNRLSESLKRLVKQSEELRSSLNERDTLLKELYHRTKNNMQVISSLLGLQASYINEKKVLDVFRDIQSRIKAMSLVHQKLYESTTLSRVNFKEYTRELFDLLIKSYGNRPDKIDLNLEIPDLHFSIDIAIPCGLILSELLSNSFKYAFPDKIKGIIKIKVHKDKSDMIEITYSDNGIGFSNGFDFGKPESLGMKIIYAISEHQLQGKVEFDTSHGITCKIHFSDGLYQERIC